MKVTGKMIKPMAKASSFMVMEKFMMVTGKVTKQTVTASISEQMALATSAIGKTTSKKASVGKLGPTEPTSKGISLRVPNRAKESSSLAMALYIRGSSSAIKSVVEANTSGLTDESM